ncbi:hypothetical protein PIIN_10587 [Serendipita indica DSM 11827]|uniref:Uncharacterized protein n=1 Tax=Serendipita indica (strain DSM 11827) TaxID=1109443 RepID=G4TZ53_SERID|nr:hypothetical protein PIIN_10587 [Serendipita indica DSM 11827]
MEIDRMFHLAAHMRTKAVVEVERREAQITLATALTNRGLYEALDSPKGAVTTWSEAIASLDKAMLGPNEYDLVEQERSSLILYTTSSMQIHSIHHSCLESDVQKTRGQQVDKVLAVLGGGLLLVGGSQNVTSRCE